MSQYALSLSLPAVYAEGNFIISDCNRAAYQYITTWPNWSQLLLSGPLGCGKTHLGHIWAHKADAAVVKASDSSFSPATINRHILLEDIESMREETLLHTINYSREKKFSLLLTATHPAQQLPFTLPDLTSRLRALPAVAIDTPDDETLAGAIRKQFADRQMKVADDVVHYLITHNERSFAALQEAIEMLDKKTLESGRNLTVPFIRKLMHSSD